MIGQRVEYLKIKDLVLWTENPRDPFDPNASDQSIVDRAIDDNNAKWTLKRLAKEMGDYYDLSELPTVVFHNNKPIVYDGNRRVILAKIQHGFAKAPDDFKKESLPSIPLEIPCNICSENIALQNVLRKHGDSGTWSPLDRDVFLHKFMDQPKSTFLTLEETTGIISANPHMNKGFVKKEILNNERLQELGIEVNNEKLLSKHSAAQTKKILDDLINKIAEEKISTRKNRGKVYEVLDKSSRDAINQNETKKPKVRAIKFSKSRLKTAKRQTARVKKYKPELFGGILYLESGEPSDIYRDISDLNRLYHSKRHSFSTSFPALIRMAMRLLCESAAKDKGQRLDEYVKLYFDKAKKKLTSDQKTTLSTQNVKKDSIVQLLQVGAHNYSASKNMEQSIAVSIILGAMLTISHGK